MAGQPDLEPGLCGPRPFGLPGGDVPARVRDDAAISLEHALRLARVAQPHRGDGLDHVGHRTPCGTHTRFGRSSVRGDHRVVTGVVERVYEQVFGQTRGARTAQSVRAPHPVLGKEVPAYQSGPKCTSRSCWRGLPGRLAGRDVPGAGLAGRAQQRAADDGDPGKRAAG
jgi:hypothetical protein